MSKKLVVRKLVIRKRVNVKALKDEFLALLDQIVYTSEQISRFNKEERQRVKEENVLPLIAFANKNKRWIDFNVSGSEHSHNVISLAFAFDAIDEVMPLIEHRRFDPNRQNYFMTIHNKRVNSVGEESIRYGQLLDQLITNGSTVSNQYREIYFSTTKYRGPPTKLLGEYFAEKGCDGNKKCISCQDEITDQEPYFRGLSNCECVLHFECCFPLVNDIVNDLTNKNPLERNIPKCPVCKITLSPSFIHRFHQILFDKISITGPLITRLPPNINDFMENLRKFQKMNLNQIDNKIYLIRYIAHPDKVNCKYDDCDGFVLVPAGGNKRVECRKCGKNQRFVGASVRLKKQDLDQFLDLIIKGSSSSGNVFNLSKGLVVRPCPNCHQLIEKLDGCNSMTCGTCRKDFTWSENLVSEKRLAVVSKRVLA